MAGAQQADWLMAWLFVEFPGAPPDVINFYKIQVLSLSKKLIFNWHTCSLSRRRIAYAAHIVVRSRLSSFLSSNYIYDEPKKSMDGCTSMKLDEMTMNYKVKIV
jgi:hypothetical protein